MLCDLLDAAVRMGGADPKAETVSAVGPRTVLGSEVGYERLMRPESGQVLHFSEDPVITRFVPHVAATAQQPEAYVWAVDHDRAPDYWFPRQCPRAPAWVEPATRFRPFGDPVHAFRSRSVRPAST